MMEEQTEMELAGLRRWNKSGVIKMESAVRKRERRREKKIWAECVLVWVMEVGGPKGEAQKTDRGEERGRDERKRHRIP